MNLKPWDLDRMDVTQVRARLEWIKDYERQVNRANDSEGVT